MWSLQIVIHVTFLTYHLSPPASTSSSTAYVRYRKLIHMIRIFPAVLLKLPSACRWGMFHAAAAMWIYSLHGTVEKEERIDLKM